MQHIYCRRNFRSNQLIMERFEVGHKSEEGDGVDFVADFQSESVGGLAYIVGKAQREEASDQGMDLRNLEYGKVLSQIASGKRHVDYLRPLTNLEMNEFAMSLSQT